MPLDFDPKLAEADLYLSVDALRAVADIAKRAINLELNADDALAEINNLSLAIIEALNK